MKLQSSLRVRLLMLVLVAVVPLFGISAYWATQEEKHELAQISQGLRAAASAEAARQGREAESTRLLLLAIAFSADVRSGNAQMCQAYLESLRDRFPAHNAGIIELDGTLRCSMRSANRLSIDKERVTYFNEAIRQRGFVVGDYMAGLLSGRPVLGFGVPIMSAGGAISGVGFAAIRLEDMQRSLRDAAVPKGAMITVLDRNARVLASTDARFKAGEPVPANWLRTASGAGVEGRADVVDPDDGKAWIYAYAPARGPAANALFVTVGVEQKTILLAGRQRLVAELAGLGLVTVLSAWLAWLYAGRQIGKPTRQILDATARLRAGKLGTRLKWASESGMEFDRIAAGLNEMAESLEARERSLNEALDENLRARATQDLILNTMREGVIAIDTDRTLLLFNHAAGEVFDRPGAPSTTPATPSFTGIYRPGSQTLLSGVDLPLQRALRGESGSDFDVFVRNSRVPEGRLLRSNYRPIMGPAGIVGGMSVFTDITQTHQLEAERILGEARLRETQRKLLDAQRIGRIGNWESDPVSRRFWWSDEVYELFGLGKANFDETWEGLFKHVHPDDRTALQAVRNIAITETGLLDTEFRIVTPAGDVRWMHARGEVRAEDQGQPAVFAGVVQDISDRKAGEAARAAGEQEARDNAERYAALFDAAPVPMWVFDSLGLRFLAVNDAAVKSYGYTRDEFMAMSLLDIRLDAGNEPILQGQADALGGEAPIETHRRKDASLFKVQAIVSQVVFGGRDACFALALDVTEQVAAKKVLSDFNRELELKVSERSRALARQEAVFSAVADQAPQVLWILNPEGAVTYLNRFWYDLVGGVPPKWQGHEWADAVDPEDVAEMRAKWRVSVGDDSAFNGLRRVSARDGSIHTLAYRGSPVHDDNGTVICWVVLDADITESKLTEEALRRANEELEAFSYSVSHDLRSPLNTIDGFSRLLVKDLKAGGGAKAGRYLSRIQAAAGHMGQLIEGLLALAQVSRQNLKMGPVNLSAIGEEIADRLQRDEPDREVHFTIDSAMVAHGDMRLLRALLQNLLGNAWKFSSKVAQAKISFGCIAARGKVPVFFVRDNGAGFEMKYVDKLFGTFQRLHSEMDYAGTGIGLATVKRIVSRHGGAVWAEATPGAGATFFFTLNAPDGQDAPH